MRPFVQMLDIVDMEGRRSGTEKHVGGFDLIYSDTTPVRWDKASSLRTSLGAELPPPLIRNLPRSLRNAGVVAARERERVVRGVPQTTANAMPPPMPLQRGTSWERVRA